MRIFANEEKDVFWPAIADLMISLFFIALILFVWVYKQYKRNTDDLEVTKNQIESIKKIERAIKELPEEYFEYDAQYKRFSLRKNIEFKTSRYNIRPQYKEYLLKVGKEILSLIQRLRRLYNEKDIRYVVIIEGMASNDGFSYNYELSYRRALEIYRFWNQNGIQFDENICEVQIAGSGTGGVGRFPKDQESRNQRILIHILPKVEYTQSDSFR